MSKKTGIIKFVEDANSDDLLAAIVAVIGGTTLAQILAAIQTLLIPLDQTMLDGVTAATDSAPIDFTNFIMKNFFINVSVNTGAATVTIEGSEDDGATFAYEIWAKTYTATTGKDNVIIASHWTHIRVTTTTHANATVTVKVRARGGA